MPFRIREDSPSPSPRPRRIAFDNFEVDLRSGEVRKNRARIRVQPQPFQLLVLLLENAGDLVTREEICRELWAADTFVDFEHSLAAAVNKIREALGDSADNPQYIETLPKRGYRFIGKIKPDAPVDMPVAEPPQTVELVPVDAAKPGISWKRILGAVAATALVAAAVAIVRRLPGSPRDSQPMTIVPFTSYPGLETAPSFSPDGSRIAFSWDSGTGNRTGRPQYDLYVKAIGSETALRLTSHPSDWISSTWSPDGTQIAFHRLAPDDNGIYVVPALGGPERKLIATRTPYDLAAPLSWSPDGKWLAYADTENGRPGNRAFLLNMETFESHEFPHDPSCLHDAYLTFSHSGQELAVLCVHNTADYEYLVTDLEGKSKRSLATSHDFLSGLVWTGDDRSLILAPFDPQSEEFYEIQVNDGRVHKLSMTSGSWPAISRDGHKLAVSVSDDHVNIWRRDLQHPEAAAVQMYSSSRPQDNSQYSPDGKYVAFDSDRSGTWSVWVARVDGSDPVQISHEGPAGHPRWSPDSQKITFEMTDPGGLIGVYTADISERVPHKLKTNIREVGRPFWSHDGVWIYFLGYKGTGHQLYRCRAEGGNATLLAGSGDAMTAVESADDKVLYFPWRYGDANMMMLALDRPGAAPQKVPGLPKVFNEFQWTLVTNGIYFTPQDNPRSICFFDFATRQTRQIFKADKDLAEGMSISPDGRYMLYSQIDESNADIMLVNNFR
jgi:Tol biopolymer transport system component/DNA-binding winged helix-turn-helix (wHTH) protein